MRGDLPVLHFLRCPLDHGELRSSLDWPWADRDGELTCKTCGARHPIRGGVACFSEATGLCPVKTAEQKARDVGARAYDGRMSKLRGRAEEPASLAALDAKEDEVVAELGAGTGRMTVQVAKAAKGVFAVDFSLASLHVLRDRMPAELAARVPLVQADLCKLPLASGAFDKVASFQTLEHVPTADGRCQALAEARRVLGAAGRFVASVYNWSRSKQRRAARGVGDNSRKEGFHATTPPIYYYNFEAPELHGLLDQAGFHKVSLRGLYLELWWLLALGGLGLPLHDRWGPTDRGREHGHLLLATADARSLD